MRVVWSHTGPKKAGDVTPVVNDGGVASLPADVVAAVKGGEPLVYEEGDVVAQFVAEAALRNIAIELQIEADNAASEVSGNGNNES